MAQGTDSQLDSVIGLEAPERDRLYREWILPHLKLSDEHREFVQTVLRIPGAKDFHSYPGQCSVDLDEHAPVQRLAKLACCILNGYHLELSGPREGGLLVPVTDPHGRLLAYRVLSNSQMARMREGHEPNTVMWWQAASALRPMMPNGEQPMHAVRAGNADTVVLMKGVGRASAIAANWKCHGISTAEEVFSFHTTVDYLHQFLAKQVLVFSPRDLSKKEAVRTWVLADQLVGADLDVKILVPVLSDLAFPQSMGECTRIAIDVWVDGLPMATQQEISRKKRAASVAESAKMDLTADELNERIMDAYNEFTAEGENPDIGSLAAAAGVHWERVMDWLKDRGVDNTTQLKMKMDAGWEPPDEIDPLAPPPETRAAEDGPSLFDLAEAEVAAEPQPVPTAAAPVEPAVDTVDSEPKESALPDTPVETSPAPAAESAPASPSTAKESALPDKPVETSPAPAAESAPASPSTGDAPDGAPPKQDGTIELVVEAQESILESETPLTQVIHGSDAPPRSGPVNTESKARVGLVLIALALLAVAFALIGTFGLPDPKEEPWEPLPITERELLPTMKTPAIAEPVYQQFDVNEVARKIKDVQDGEASGTAPEGE